MTTHDDTQNTTQDPQEEVSSGEESSLQAELEQMKALASRAAADYANLKRQHAEEQKTLMVFANKRLLEAVLPAVDDLKRACEHLPEKLKEDAWAKGIPTLLENFQKKLAALGLESFDPTGSPANPMEHEILMEVPGAKGQVVSCFELGYRYGETLIRPARVSVGNGEGGLE